MSEESIIEITGTVFEMADNDLEDAFNGFQRTDCSPRFEFQLKEYEDVTFEHDGTAFPDEGEKVVLFVDEEDFKEAKENHSPVHVKRWEYPECEEGSWYEEAEIRGADGSVL